MKYYFHITLSDMTRMGNFGVYNTDIMHRIYTYVIVLHISDVKQEW
jgi:hypothetical protein